MQSNNTFSAFAVSSIAGVTLLFAGKKYFQKYTGNARCKPCQYAISVSNAACSPSTTYTDQTSLPSEKREENLPPNLPEENSSQLKLAEVIPILQPLNVKQCIRFPQLPTIPEHSPDQEPGTSAAHVENSSANVPANPQQSSVPLMIAQAANQ